MSISAYQRVRVLTEMPRAAEHRLMTQVTQAMVAARDAGLAGVALMPALHHNREVWQVLAGLCAAPDNALPPTLRAALVSLAMWVDRHTSAVIKGRETIDELIIVNLDVIAGLSAQSEA